MLHKASARKLLITRDEQGDPPRHAPLQQEHRQPSASHKERGCYRKPKGGQGEKQEISINATKSARLWDEIGEIVGQSRRLCQPPSGYLEKE